MGSGLCALALPHWLSDASMPPPFKASHFRTPRIFQNMTYTSVLVSLPFASAALYLAYLHITLSSKVQCQTTPGLQDATIAVPDAVRGKPEEYIIHHECARKMVPTASLETTPDSEMLTLFLRHTMTAFSRYPPAWGLWYLTKNTKDRDTFNPTYIQSLQFIPGDRVCGVYIVTLRDRGCVTLTLDAPASYVGPRVEGLLVVEIKEDGSQTAFSNHTVIWREKDRGSAGVLEGAVGRWMHGLQVRSLIENGVKQLSSNRVGSKYS